MTDDEKVQAVIKSVNETYEEPLTEGDLDDMVHDLKAAEGTDINNNGTIAQVHYILTKHGGDVDAAVAAICEVV